MHLGAMIPACAVAGPDVCILDARAGSIIEARLFRIDLAADRRLLHLLPLRATANAEAYCPRSESCGNGSQRGDGSLPAMDVAWFGVGDATFVRETFDDRVGPAP